MDSQVWPDDRWMEMPATEVRSDGGNTVRG